MEYIDLQIDYNKPFGRIEQLYEDMGIFEIIKEAKIKHNIPEDACVSYQLLKCNKETHRKLQEQFIYNWKYYNYDRFTGQVPTGRKLRKYKRPHPLSHGDESRITWNYDLGCSPVEDETVPNDIIRVVIEWDEETVKDIMRRYEIDRGLKNL